MHHDDLTQGRYHAALGVWIRARAPFRGTPKPALFLDRDGVIVRETNYLCCADDVLMIDGAAELIAAVNRAGIPLIVVTNQAGIGRGYYGWDGFEDVENEIKRQLDRSGAWIDAALACPFHPEAQAAWRHESHPARKPGPGMLLNAASLLNLDLSRSWIVGDHASDMAAGYKAGLRGGLHVLTGHGRNQREAVIGQLFGDFELRLGESISHAAALVSELCSKCVGATADPN
jgi:D-glycero-D-manno-heptose 1,7-bisphosphate phosphatase